MRDLIRVNTLKTAVLLGLLCAVLGTGCTRKINKKQATLLNTVRVSLAFNGKEGNAEVLNPQAAVVTENERAAISDDGRYVAFSSKASNLVPTDSNGISDVFRRDNLMKTTELVSINNSVLTPDSGNGASSGPSISGDGNLVVFQSLATNLTGDTVSGTTSHIFIRNMTTGVTTLVSRASGNAAIGNGNSRNPHISATGRYVVWDSKSTNFDIVNDTDAGEDIYRRDLGAVTLDTILISRVNGVLGARGNAASTRPTVTADGRLVCFQSNASNLTPSITEGGPDGNLKTDIFVRDTATGTTIRVSVSKPGAAFDPDPQGISENAMISADGNFVVYRSDAPDIVAEDDGPSPDIFLRDLVAGTTQILSVHSSGAQAGNSCNYPRISANGQIVVWDSFSPNLVNGDANGVRDIFMRNRVTKLTTRISVSTFGGELNGASLRPNLSSDGRYVVFYTEASNAADDDTNGTGDIYLRGPPF
jgi:hypothetical protein